MPNADPVMRPAAALTPEAKLARARRRVAALKGFYIHLGVFALVLIALLVVNIVAGGRWWVAWVFLGWGIGVLSHGLAVMGRGSRAIAAWEERKLRHYLAEADDGPSAGRFDPGRPT